MRIRIILILLAFLHLSANAVSSQTLHFLKHEDSLIVSECDFGTHLQIGIWNSADTEQYIRGEEGSPFRLGLYNMTAIFRDGYYRVGPRDTVWGSAYPFASVTATLKFDTVVLESDGGNDTLFIKLQSYRDSIAISGEMPTGMIPSGTKETQEFILTNYGTHPFPLLRMRLSGMSLPEPILLDTIQVGERRTIGALIANQYPGRFEAMIAVSSCAPDYGRSHFRVYDPHAYFSNDLIIDTVFGCSDVLQGHDIIFYLKNLVGPAATIKSITLNGTPGLRLADSTWKGVSIQKDDSIAIRFRREFSEFAWTDVTLETTSGVKERGHIESALRWSKPRFHIDIDTLRLHGSGTDHFFDQFWLEALGNEPSIITSLSISDSVHWQVTGAKVGDTLQQNRLVFGETRFKGAEVSGDYPVTLRITTTPCDTVLVRTVIMKVTSSDVSQDALTHSLTIYPTPARDVLHIEVAAPATVKLLDILGNEVLPSTHITERADLDIHLLPSGQYILVVDYLDKKESRMISIKR